MFPSSNLQVPLSGCVWRNPSRAGLLAGRTRREPGWGAGPAANFQGDRAISKGTEQAVEPQAHEWVGSGVDEQLLGPSPGGTSLLGGIAQSNRQERQEEMQNPNAMKSPRGDREQWQTTAFLAALAAIAGLLLLCQSSAQAATVTQRPLLFSFKTGQVSAENIAVDDSTGAIYVSEGGLFGAHTLVARFHADGTPWSFPATGTNKVGTESNGIRVAVDNSGGSMQGRFYLNEPNSPFGQRIRAYDPEGNLLWALQSNPARDIAVDDGGHLWTAGYGQDAVEYDTTTSPPEQIGSMSIGGGLEIDLDSSGALYAMFGSGPASLTKWVDGTAVLNLPGGNGDLALDQSTSAGHLFVLYPGQLTEFEQDGTELSTYASDYLSGDGSEFGTETRSVAYYPAQNRLYVFVGRSSEEQEQMLNRPNPTVLEFGPAATGTVPDVSNAPPTSIGVSGAHFSGTVNPQGTNSEWYFEWKKEGQNWLAAESSPPHGLPADSTDHAVEFDANSLRGNTSYEVRLAAVNTANSLVGFSDEEPFSTTTAAVAPAVTINPAADIGTDSATITGAVDPEGDTADWNVQTSTDPSCESGFQDQSPQPLSPAANSPQPVEWQLGSLLPSQHYCARITASNSAGSTVSSVVEFTTDPVAATDLEPIGVAPRLDTSVRLNAEVNPEGEDLTYRFEYSSDGGSSWNALPDQTDESNARSRVVISSEVTGLQPSTSYLFRVTVENPVGGAQSDEASFTTRSTSEVTLPPIGDELVNSPDKGNQNAVPVESTMEVSPVTADGNRFLWMVNAGAPGTNTGAEGIFLAERTATGWTSRSLVPPAAQQIGGGELGYALLADTPDMSHFVMKVARWGIFNEILESGMVRLDDEQHQQVLGTLSGNLENAAVTDDGSHVIALGNAEGKLLDIGAGGTPEILSIMPDGTEATCPLHGGFGFNGPNPNGGAGGADVHWIPGYGMNNTQDASLVYFEVQPNGECSASLGLYMRDRNTEETHLIDPGSNGSDVNFIRATPDGKHAFFTTVSRLAPQDTNKKEDIYEWDAGAEESACLTCIVPEAVAGSGSGSVLVSDDFSHIYFKSPRQLIPGKGSPGTENVYVLAGGVLHFVANEGNLNYKHAILSSDGKTMIFTAVANPSLTSDEVGPTCHYRTALEEAQHGGAPTALCIELYRYEAESESLECISCSREGRTTYQVGTPGNESWDFRMSADRSTIGFITRQALLPRDVNRNTDIYEWRNGALRLLTDGVTTYQEEIAAPKVNAVDADGSNIFFSVVQPGLTGYEQDELLNVYDARVGGGFPRPTTPPHCSEESCQGPLQSPPGQAEIGSAHFNGHGNATAGGHRRRCNKGKVRRHGRCIRKHQRGHHRRSGRHSKQGRGK